jgi:hypothetical protein
MAGTIWSESGTLCAQKGRRTQLDTQHRMSNNMTLSQASSLLFHSTVDPGKTECATIFFSHQYKYIIQ